MRYLERELDVVFVDIDEMDFPAFIRSSRLSLGITQRKAAEFLCITPTRLSRLEFGQFKHMPHDFEISAFSKLFDIKYSILWEKAYDFVDKARRDRVSTKYEEDFSERLHKMRANFR